MSLSHTIKISAQSDWDFETSLYLSNVLHEMLFLLNSEYHYLDPKEKIKNICYLLESENIPFQYKQAHHRISGEELGSFIDCAGSLWGAYGIKSFSSLLERYAQSEIELKSQDWNENLDIHPHIHKLKRHNTNLNNVVMVNTLEQDISLKHLFHLNGYQPQWKEDYQKKIEDSLGFRLYIRIATHVEEQETNRLKEQIEKYQRNLQESLKNSINHSQETWSLYKGHAWKQRLQYLIEICDRGIELLESQSEHKTSFMFNFGDFTEPVKMRKKDIDVSNFSKQKTLIELINALTYHQQHFYISKERGFQKIIDKSIALSFNQVISLEQPLQMIKTIPSNMEEYQPKNTNEIIEKKSIQTLFQVHNEHVIQQKLKLQKKSTKIKNRF